ncbi:MAG: ATP-binding protein [Flavobacteriales bacterium]|jgi:serine/threonine-protein kinase RsbW|nr:ATP-binding protein [Flavobacteriales bacterium]MCI1751829.1 ATP-binding protein [Flavobacteriales bacterium]
MGTTAQDVHSTKHIDFPAKAENIALAEKLIDQACAEHKVPEALYGNILIALTEAVNNAIHHGNALDPEKRVSMEYDTQGELITFRVSDEGPGFDYENLPDPTDPRNIEKPHGRGVFLMRALSDKVSFADNGATVELAFSLKPPVE